MTIVNIFILVFALLGCLFQNSNQVDIQKYLVTGNSSATHVIRPRQVPQATMKSTPDYIRSYGYPAEAHEVTTADGYILTMIRIPFGKDRNLARSNAILIHHGLLADSSCWVLNDPDKLLILQLADLGYDVWLANCRGTRYSRRHVKYTVKDRAFFDFSMDEIGKYDVPAEIDYILNTTGFPKLQYMGHSMGGIVFHIAMSNFPEYNKKVSLMIGAAPAVYVGHLTGTVGILKNTYGETLIKDSIAKAVVTIPSSSSVRVGRHFTQMGYSNNFEHYNYGAKKNLQVYGSKTPPLYHLKDTTVPVGVFYGKSDNLVVPKDIARLVSELPNCVYVRGIGEDRKGSHLDFLVAKDINEMFNKPFIDLALKYQ